jgi:ATP-dependent 26S proteasome regulatory subunit
VVVRPVSDTGARADAQVEKAPLESYADVGGLDQQIQEIKEAVELPLTHPELYEDIGIKPPKVPAAPARAPLAR